MKCLLLLLLLLNSFAQSVEPIWIYADVQTNYKLSFFFEVTYNGFPEQLYTVYRQAASQTVGAVVDYTHVTLYIYNNYCIFDIFLDRATQLDAAFDAFSASTFLEALGAERSSVIDVEPPGRQCPSLPPNANAVSPGSCAFTCISGYYAVIITGNIESCAQCTASDLMPACSVPTAALVIQTTIVTNLLDTNSTVLATSSTATTSTSQVEETPKPAKEELSLLLVCLVAECAVVFLLLIVLCGICMYR